MRIRRALLPVTIFALATLGAQKPAHAGDIAAAEALFNEGQKLFAAGQIHQACEKFGESYAQDPAVGTMINLARCHEKEGKTATAWGEYKTVEALAARSNQKEREQFAHDEASKLEPTLHKLVLNVKFPVEGIEVTRNGTVIGKGQWGSEVPVDPGDVMLKATAPGKKDWSMPVHLAAGPGVDHFDVPALEDAPVEKPPPGKDTGVTPVGGGGWSTPKLVGAGLAGAGFVSLSAAVVFWVVSQSQDNSATKSFSDASTSEPQGCKIDDSIPKDAAGNTLCKTTLQGVSQKSAAKSDQTYAQVLGATGGILLVTGVVLFFTAGPAEAKTPQKGTIKVLPNVGRDQTGLSLVGTF
jgi:hypothetical protein